MATITQMGTAMRCVRCQRHALNGFLSLAGLNISSWPARLNSGVHRPPQRRHLANSRSIPSLDNNHIEQPFQISQKQQSATESGSLATRGAPEPQEEEVESMHLEEEDITSGEKPWYLQEEDDIIPETSIAERQRLPDLPEDAPKDLSDIVQHLSTDIGLDYIRLLDLRSLDPPPALGAGVIMLIGTARSEKHLHVSADRFARWLRKTYKLKPDADGLMGRNELKLILRRKARKAKLLRSVGAIQRDEEDDGIRTGWICVNAGFIEETSSAEVSLDDSGIIGFGSQTDGVRLVVQIMTENKRRDLDLETLWGNALERQRRRLAGLEAEESVEEQNGSVTDEVHEQHQEPSAAVSST